MTDPAYTTEEPPPGPPPERQTNPWVVAAGLAFLAVIIGIIVLAAMDDDDEDEDIVSDTTTTEPVDTTDPDDTTTTVDDDEDADTTTTTEPTTTTTTDPDTITDEERDTIVWPAPEDSRRFEDPVSAATSFAVDLAGFVDPVVGEFRRGDQRSGEVGIRATESGPESIVVVRQLSDDTWWVLAADTDSIELDEPAPADAIDDPVTVSGRARAVEGNVEVAVYASGDRHPIGTGVVTASGGEELGSFSGEVSFDRPGASHGALVLFTRGGEDGQVWEVFAIPVQFANA